MMEGERLSRPNPFPEDDGAVPSGLAEAFAVDDPALRQEAIVSSLESSRVFVALLPPEEGSQEMRKAHVEIGGRQALVVFSGSDALASAYPEARPQPLIARNAAAQAFMADGLLALDPVDSQGAGALPIGRAACAAIASGEQWIPVWKDREALRRLRESVRIVERCLDVWVRPGQDGACLVALQMSETSDRSDAERAVALVTHALGHDEYLNSRFELVHVVPVKTA